MNSEFDYSSLEWHGRDVYISGNVVIKRPQLVSVGSHVAIDDYFYSTVKMILGSYLHFSPHISVIGGADATFWVGNFCTISGGARIICKGDRMLGDGLVGPIIPPEYRDKVVGNSIIIESFCSIGTNVVLMPDVKLAEGVVVGAGSVVTKPITSPWTIWVGSPARKVKDRPREKMLAYAKELMKDE